MNITNETKFFIGVAVASILILAIGIFLVSQPEKTLSREELITSDTPIAGNASASAYLVEFSDFQCPACKAFKPSVDEVLAKYQDKLTFGYRHFPLDQHPWAQKAAYVSEAAKKQGKFWEMYSHLFDNQENFSEEFLASPPAELKLDLKKFTEDVNLDEVKNKVAADRAAGLRFGVDSTPTFFLNGKKLNLSSPQDLVAKVKAALQ